MKSVFSVIRRSRSDESHLLTHLLTESLSVLIDLTDVTLVSDDTYRRLSGVILITLMTLMKVI